ncbi:MULTISPECIES: GAF domain-containing protein [unclassified Streptomyces]|uniref:GAF domain-containing protein n=1 Tax=unclassified Streptomyces TaxID=2593676 RepID=UPI001C2EED40|nr:MULTISPECIES: GAF domain-containing protein [unclassified Streptomyces]MBV1949117.1 GAF domain-containing protein [Streptomyces sp. BV129]
MPTFNPASGLHDTPEDPDLARRKELLPHLGLADGPVPQFDALARSLATAASELVGHQHLGTMVNIIQDDQHFVGLCLPAPTGGASQADTPATTSMRRMPLSEGWCVHTLHRRRALPLDDVHAMPRWSGNGAISRLRVQSYLGVPLIHRSTGVALGTICAISTVQNTWGRAGVELIKKFGEQGLDLIDHIAAEHQQTQRHVPEHPTPAGIPAPAADQRHAIGTNY